MLRHWKRILGICLALVLLTVSAAQADVYLQQDTPADWAQRTLMHLIVVDTDRSDAMILICGGEAMMVDGGEAYYHPFVLEALERWLEEPRLKYLYNTHCDNDHIGGLPHIMSSGRYEVGAYLSPYPAGYSDEYGYHQWAVRTAQYRGVPYETVEDGDELALGSASLRVMRCLEPWGHNARSAVLMVTFGETRLLLAADIDYGTMSHFVKKYGAEALRADVFKTPHHGITTIPDEFCEAVSPRLILVTNHERRVEGYSQWMRICLPDAPLLYSGDGTLVLETDGVDWYAWQEENSNH